MKAIEGYRKRVRVRSREIEGVSERKREREKYNEIVGEKES